MERRDALKAAVWGGAIVMLAPRLASAKVLYPVHVEEELFQGINRAKNPTQETHLEKLHSPVIKAPEKVKAGKVFPVEVIIGQTPHPMGPNHWIEHLQFNIGNEPAGNIIFRSHGYVQAAGKFDTVLSDELKGKTISLVVQIKCNLHGIWQNDVPVKVV
jgi:superoxide reductase